MADITPEEWFEVKSLVKRLDGSIFGNGKPALEVRLREYIDQRDAHKEANAQQDLIDLRTDVDRKHEENGKKLDRLDGRHDQIQKLVYIGMGIMIALESVGLFKK